MKTRISEIFNIKYPIIQGGMIWASGYKLVSAVSNAGGLGLIGAGSMRPDLFREHIQKCKQATDKPFGVNIPLIYKYSKEMINIALEEGVKIFFTSAGSPKKYTKTLKDNGCKVVHVVASAYHAKKVEDAGCDAVVVEGFEAGGHNGRQELTTMVLVPAAVDAVSIPVIAAGGIADGRGIAAAFALGAEGVQIGTRFAISQESSLHEKMKEACVNAKEDDTFLILKKLIPTRVIINNFAKQVLELENKGASKEELAELLGEGRARKGMFEGDLENGELEIGQAVAIINNIPSVAEIMQQLVNGYEQAKKHCP